MKSTKGLKSQCDQRTGFKDTRGKVCKEYIMCWVDTRLEDHGNKRVNKDSKIMGEDA